MSCPYEKSYKQEHEGCPARGYQEVKVGVPVEIKPFAKVGAVKTECIGNPLIERDSKMCEGKPKQICKFTVSQKMRVEVPVIFGAKTEVGEARIDCRHHGFPCDVHKEEKEHKEHKEYKDEEELFRGMIG